jgi:hypothetical protein
MSDLAPAIEEVERKLAQLVEASPRNSNVRRSSKTSTRYLASVWLEFNDDARRAVMGRIDAALKAFASEGLEAVVSCPQLEPLARKTDDASVE